MSPHHKLYGLVMYPTLCFCNAWSFFLTDVYLLTGRVLDVLHGNIKRYKSKRVSIALKARAQLNIGPVKFDGASVFPGHGPFGIAICGGGVAFIGAAITSPVL